jgi:hypothetical protein
MVSWFNIIAGTLVALLRSPEKYVYFKRLELGEN